MDEVIITGFTLDDVDRLVEILYHAPGGHGDLVDTMRENYARLRKEANAAREH